ncbi:MAG: nitrous oxide reductase accessory protein NosL [Gemmatimonadales bacterium]
MVRAARVSAVVTLVLLACTVGPRPIVYDEDTCARCRMVVSDRRYGAELVTATGRVLVYDGIECVAQGVREAEAGDVVSVWVTDSDQPETLIRAETAYFLQAASLPSPMGAGLTAFATREGREAQAARHPGALLDWAGVLEQVRDGHGH